MKNIKMVSPEKFGTKQQVHVNQEDFVIKNFISKIQGITYFTTHWNPIVFAHNIFSKCTKLNF